MIWTYPISRLGAILRAFFRWIRCLLTDWKPKYEPERWNDPINPGLSLVECQWCNNCYDYSTDLPSDHFAQPGYAAGAIVMPYYGMPWEPPTCQNTASYAGADGLTVRPDGAQSIGHCRHTVALVIQPDTGAFDGDFHWYRLDRDGTWSHKPGRTTVRNVDNSGDVITDPRIADRGPYTEFCGFFTVDRHAVRVDGWLNP